ncbi:MAG TPA: hypothetical protein VGU43_07500 [Thermoplasmata archaeon]|nr:hypothetical protein [Thermoplasmata archaeon]
MGFGLTVDPSRGSNAVAEGLLRDALRQGVRLVDVSSGADPRPAEALVGAVGRGEPGLRVLAGIPASELSKVGGAIGLARTAAAVQQCLRRLGRDALDALVLPWDELQGLRAGGALPGLRDALPEMGVRSLAVRLEDDGLDAGTVRALAAEGIRIFLARWNLLETGASDALLPALSEHACSLLSVDPHANGRLDGRRMLSPTAGRPAGTPPLDAAALRRTMGPVLSLRYLTEGTGRTLVQAAVQFALDPPAVASVLCPLEDPRLTAQICGYDAAPPFSAEERRRLGLKAPA